MSKLGITLRKCESLSSSDDWRSFKLSMGRDDRDKLLKADVWPEGVFVRKFFKVKSSNNQVRN